MKRISTTLFVMLGFVYFSNAQTLVSTSPLGRNAVLEEFTGLNCPNCPDGHARANALANAHPGKVVIINVHSGSFAVPSGSQPDFRTIYGESIDSMVGVSAYPSGTMNRIVWPGAYNQPPYFPQNPPNNLAIRRPGWWDTGYPGQGAGEYIINNGGLSHVNAGASTTWNSNTRQLDITVELYYTTDDTVSNRINVVLTENGIIAYQSGGSSNYHHNHMLREMITGLWGDDVQATSQGTFVSRNYTYIVPSTFNIDSCDISVFVTRNNYKYTHTGIVIPAKNGTTATGITDPVASLSSINIYPNPLSDESMISFNLKKKSEISVELSDVAGRKIAYAFLGTKLPGAHDYFLNDLFEVRDLENGVYFVKLVSGSESRVTKISVNR